MMLFGEVAVALDAVDVAFMLLLLYDVNNFVAVAAVVAFDDADADDNAVDNDDDNG